MMTCKDVSTLVSTGGLSHAPPARRLGARLHLAMCRRCRAFRRQVEALGRAAGALGRTFEAEPAAGFEPEIVRRLLS
jgi:hypothetical protein